MKTWLKAAGLILLVLAVLLEAYYILMLRDTMRRQTEDLKSISMELQALKTEHNTLSEELASAKKEVGEKGHGNTPAR